MDGWQYKTLPIKLEQGLVDDQELDKILNELGADGWELIAVSPVFYEGRTDYLVHHFRRTGEPKRRVGFTG